MKNSELQQKLRILQKNFLEHLPQKMRDIEETWSLVKNEWDKEKVLLLFRLVHNLKGTAGTYGYQDFSHAIGRVEECIEKSLERSFRMDEISEIESNLDECKQVIARLNKVSLPIIEPLEQDASLKLVYLLDRKTSVRERLANEFKAFRYEVKQCSSVSALEKALKQQKPFAVILDHRFFEKFKRKWSNSLSQTRDYLLIAITESNDFKSHLAAVRAGCHYYLSKPFDLEELIDKFDHYLRRIQSQYTVLIVEDSIEVAQHYSLLLQASGIKVYVLTKPEDINKALVMFHPDLILMDIYMPDINGLELAAMIRQQEKYASIPIIFLSSEEDKAKQLQALSLGVDDFITKSTKPEFVILAIKNCAERYRLLNALIVKDSLTGVLNHSTTHERLGEMIKEANRLGTVLSVAMVDLDDFKQVNDQYGHLKGDQVLKNLCFLLRKRLRETDVIGRYGGEEFLIVFPNTYAKQAKKILDEIRMKFLQCDYSHEGEVFHVSFSAGVAEYAHPQQCDELIQNADELLYEAKRKGKNLVVDQS